ncbi:MAG: hypothetical protein Q7S37_03620 [bacterium]|nr:hypothetical protein [bacterium]
MPEDTDPNQTKIEESRENNSLVMPAIEELKSEDSAEQKSDTSAVQPEQQSEGEVSDLINDRFTPEDAREELERSTNIENTTMMAEDANPDEKKIFSPIVWLVGILCFLALGLVVVWLVAK